MCHQYCLFN